MIKKSGYFITSDYKKLIRYEFNDELIFSKITFDFEKIIKDVIDIYDNNQMPWPYSFGYNKMQINNWITKKLIILFLECEEGEDYDTGITLMIINNFILSIKPIEMLYPPRIFNINFNNYIISKDLVDL